MPEPQQEEEEEQVNRTQWLSNSLILFYALCSTWHATSVTVSLHASAIIAKHLPPSPSLSTRPAHLWQLYRRRQLIWLQGLGCRRVQRSEPWGSTDKTMSSQKSPWVHTLYPTSPPMTAIQEALSVVKRLDLHWDDLDKKTIPPTVQTSAPTHIFMQGHTHRRTQRYKTHMHTASNYSTQCPAPAWKTYTFVEGPRTWHV